MQLHSYCSSAVLGILNLVIVSLNLVRLVLFEGEVNWWKLGFQPDNHIINDITITGEGRQKGLFEGRGLP